MENIENLKKTIENKQDLTKITQKIIQKAEIEELCTAAHILKHNNIEISETINNKALELNKSYIPALITKGTIARIKKQFTKAKNAYEQAIAIDANCTSAWYNLGVLAEHQNKPDLAIEKYERIQEKHSMSQIRIGICLQKQNKHTAAIKHFKKLKQSKPNNTNILYLLAQSQQQTQQLESARSNLEQLLLIEPENIDAQHSIATIHSEQKQYKMAINSFLQVLKISPQHPEALHNLASIYYFLKQFRKALDCWLKQLSIKPDQYTNYNVGSCYLAIQQHDEAKPYLIAACKDLPQKTEPLINLASIYIKQEQWPKVIKLYKQALTIEPNNDSIKYVLAAIQQTENSYEKAPSNYIKNLFDQYADNFERHLLDNLKYKAHTIIKDNLANHIDQSRLHVIADIGCGTGLCGAECKQWAKRLIGVDLSPEMLAQAHARNIYENLHEQDAESFLAENYALDIIIAGDVMPYIGNLTPILNKAYAALNNFGIMIFTIELTQKKQEFYLAESGRYQHNSELLIKSLDKSEWNILECINVVTRTQNFQPVTGQLFILQKSV